MKAAFLLLVLLSACGRSPAPPTPPEPAANHEGHTAPAPTTDHSGHTSVPTVSVPTVDVSAEAVAALGIRSEPATSGDGQIQTRAPAAASWDPLKVVRATTQMGGQLRTVSVPRPGERVSSGQVLAHIYQPELRGAFSELIVSVGLGEPWLGAARSRLNALGVSNPEIDAALTMGRAPETTALRAPASGIILDRPVVEGAWLAPGAVVALIGDPTAILVEVEVAGTLPALGQQVELQDPATGQRWEATVLATLPTASAAGSRVRLMPSEAIPVGRPLLAEWETPVIGGVWVPRSALVDTGERRIVFVELAPGRYEPRTVEVGVRTADRIQLLSGLDAGERVVVSGTFLLDSETQIGSMGHAGHGG